MTMITAEEVIEFTGIKPQTFRFEKNDYKALKNLIDKWILQSESLIVSYTNNPFKDSVPPAVSNVCLRLTANMITLAQAHKDTSVINSKDWNVNSVDSNIFSEDLKNDLLPFMIERKSYKSDKIDFFVVSRED